MRNITYLLYACFKNTKYLRETFLSILTLKEIEGNNFKNIPIVILIDENLIQTNDYYRIKNDFINCKNIVFERIKETELKYWIGETGYIFNTKIKSIEYFFNKYKNNVLFCDGDTFFIDKIKNIFDLIESKNFVMHTPYMTLEETDRIGSIDNFMLDCITYNYIANNSEYPITKEFRPFNSGNIGINYAYRNIVDEVYKLTDLIYKKYKAEYAEEYAFSYIINKYTNKIYSADYNIGHYVLYKWMRYVIAIAFQCITPEENTEISDLISSLNFPDIRQLKLSLSEWLCMVVCLFYISGYDEGFCFVFKHDPKNIKKIMRIIESDQRYSNIIQPLRQRLTDAKMPDAKTRKNFFG